MALTLALHMETNLTSLPHEDLDLRSNGIGNEGALQIASALIGLPSTLRKLNLMNNHIGAEGAIAIASALVMNKTLQEISLKKNNIGSDGAVAIASALMNNSTLKKLDLRYNNIGIRGIKSILRTFHRSHYPIVKIYCNKVDKSQQEILSKCREVNETLSIVDKTILRSHNTSNMLLLLPHVIHYVSTNQQHVSKLFAVLRERPDLLLR
jgi:Ran GTPase-activating protein (RanGAP) involved in mRNA processing and transport